MILYIPKVKERHILFMDIEYDCDNLIQFAGFLMEKVEDKESLYRVKSSLSVFAVQNEISPYVAQLIHVTPTDLQRFGKPIEEVRDIILNDFLQDIDDLHIVSHGIRQDMNILYRNGIEIEGNRECSKSLAEKLYGKETKISLTALSERLGFKHPQAHDAFYDAEKTMMVFSYLKYLEEKNESN